MVKFESILLHVLYQKYEGLSYVNRVGLFFEVRIMSSKHYKQKFKLELARKTELIWDYHQSKIWTNSIT